MYALVQCLTVKSSSWPPKLFSIASCFVQRETTSSSNLHHLHKQAHVGNEMRPPGDNHNMNPRLNRCSWRFFQNSNGNTDRRTVSNIDARRHLKRTFVCHQWLTLSASQEPQIARRLLTTKIAPCTHEAIKYCYTYLPSIFGLMYAT